MSFLAGLLLGFILTLWRCAALFDSLEKHQSQQARYEDVDYEDRRIG